MENDLFFLFVLIGKNFRSIWFKPLNSLCNVMLGSFWIQMLLFLAFLLIFQWQTSNVSQKTLWLSQQVKLWFNRNMNDGGVPFSSFIFRICITHALSLIYWNRNGKEAFSDICAFLTMTKSECDNMLSKAKMSTFSQIKSATSEWQRFKLSYCYWEKFCILFLMKIILEAWQYFLPKTQKQTLHIIPWDGSTNLHLFWPRLLRYRKHL